MVYRVFCLSLHLGYDMDEFGHNHSSVKTASFFLGKFNGAIGHGKDGIISPAFHVFPDVEFSASLANNYHAFFDGLAVMELYA